MISPNRAGHVQLPEGFVPNSAKEADMSASPGPTPVPLPNGASCQKTNHENLRNGIFYIGIMGGFSALMYWVVLMGAQLEQGKNIVRPSEGEAAWGEFKASLSYNLEHPLAILIAQMITIILIARLF